MSLVHFETNLNAGLTPPKQDVVAVSPTNPLPVTLTNSAAASGAGGLAAAPSRLISAAATTNGTVVKATAGRVYKIRGYNAAAAVRYLKFSNSATITPGTTAVVCTFALKPSSDFDIDFGTLGLFFSTGICFCLTTGSADNDTAALTAADIVGLNIFFA